jgi:hypothetical protein
LFQDYLALTHDVEVPCDKNGIAIRNKCAVDIKQIITLCGDNKDSTMVKVFKQHGWTDIEHITVATFIEIKDL